MSTGYQGRNPLAGKHPGVFPTHGNVGTPKLEAQRKHFGAHVVVSGAYCSISPPSLSATITAPGPIALRDGTGPTRARRPPVRSGRCHFVAPQARSARAAPAGLPRRRPPPQGLRARARPDPHPAAGHGQTHIPQPSPAAPGPGRAAPDTAPARTTFPGSAGRGPAGPGWGCWEGRRLASWLSGASGRDGLFGLVVL